MKRLVALVALALAASPASAIFVNGGFEAGDFSGWATQTGTNPSLSGTPPFTAANIQVSAGGSNTSAVVGAGIDPRAPHLVLPRAGSFTARVNDFNGGAIVNAIRQSAPISSADRDATDGLLHVRFSYAAVLEDPGHGANEQPYFFVRLRNLTKGTTLYEDFTFSNQPGKTLIRTGQWLATNFINVDIIVPDADINDNLEIEAYGVDCSPSAHGGYVHLDGFGSAIVGGPGPAQSNAPIPTLSEWALILLALMIGGVAFVQRRNGRLG